MELPNNFVKNVILRQNCKDIMNTMARSVLEMAAYDEDPTDVSTPHVLKQCMKIIATLPLFAVYGYHAYNHYDCNKSLIIHRPDHNLSMAENILMMLRPDGKFTATEAEALDNALIIHMEHGGGNNSAFTTRVITSAGSDTYSVIAGALLSLKGPKHGGANIKVVQMMDDIKANVIDPTDDGELSNYLSKILNKEAFDRQGLIYGMGHAVYSISDPRAQQLKQFVYKMAREKGCDAELDLYERVARIAPDVIATKRKSPIKVCVNVDYYSGFLYRMLGIPEELYTPLFAIARASGWSAHRIEELVSSGKIIRPAYVSIAKEREYVPLEKR
jgi:citrate synthase